MNDTRADEIQAAIKKCAAQPAIHPSFFWHTPMPC